MGLNGAVVKALLDPDWAAAEGDLRWLDQAGNAALTIADPRYPRRLREIADPPPLLFVRGRADILDRPQLAIVGSRNPSASGGDTAFEFAALLSRSGLAITSGLALGIDACGHRGALYAGGLTIAVAGTGLDRVYPAVHQDLALQIAEQGALVSELPPEAAAKAHHFPRRNRIISGLCQGLLVVEAAKQSGSLITARLALEQNRDVFAVPGSIHNPLARGCNALIREGAKLVETAHDILEDLNIENQVYSDNLPVLTKTGLDLEQQTLLNLVMFSPTSIDQLVEATGRPVEHIASTLLILELQGYLEANPGGCYTRLK